MPLEMESVLASMLAGMPISILLEMMGVSAPFLATMLITMPLEMEAACVVKYACRNADNSAIGKESCVGDEYALTGADGNTI